jgi:hypothetical protein
MFARHEKIGTTHKKRFRRELKFSSTLKQMCGCGGKNWRDVKLAYKGVGKIAVTPELVRKKEAKMPQY